MNTKKILLSVVVLAILLTTVLGAVACVKNPVQITESTVVVPLDSKIMSDIEGKHLVDYLNVLVEKEFLTYNAPGGFIDTINELKADGTKGEYWLIYTDDAENSNESWGKTEIDGKTYLSAKFGINDMPLKEGKTYVFMISKFES